MASPEIIVKENAGDLSSHAARLFTTVAAEAIRTHGSFTVSLAGGSTPRNLYSLLSSAPYRNELDWTKAALFFGDERNVPPESPDSNFRMAKETLLEPLGISPGQIFRWRTEIGDANSAAKEYDDKLREHINFSGRGLDLMLLGLGSDGHTASLFPHTTALGERQRVAVANWVDQLDDYRLTVTFPVINSSSNVVFLVSGPEKAPVVARILDGEFRPDEFPAQFVNPENGALFWLLDRAAAAGLDDPI